MTFLQKKLQETIPEIIYKQILLVEDNLEEFEELYENTLSSLTAPQLNTLLDFLIAKKKVSEDVKISISQKLLSHHESFLREKSILYLESFQQKESVQYISPLIIDLSPCVRARVFWVLAKHSEDDANLTQQIFDDLTINAEDTDQVILAGALYLRNNSPSSIEMRFLRDFYLENYYDTITQKLKVNITGKLGFAAQGIGLILWEAGIEIFAIDSLEILDMNWLIEKANEKVSL